jgi:hypothetical protein
MSAFLTGLRFGIALANLARTISIEAKVLRLVRRIP